MKKRYISIFLCFVICLLSFVGCTKKEKEKFTDYSFDFFDTATTIIGYEYSKEDFDKVAGKIKKLLGEYHKLYNIYERYSEVNNLLAINEKKTEIQVSEKLIDMLAFCKEMYVKTEGKTNIAMGSVLSIWHNYRERGNMQPVDAELPPMEKLKTAAEHTDIEKLLINNEKNTVSLIDSEMLLDVGAVAKGYAVERVAEWMAQNGIEGYILNVGGNIRTIGERIDGKWKVGIENPNDENSEKPYIAYLELADMSLVTSGSYQRFYIVNGKNYHHIIDPETLMPAEYFLSVSVICKDSGEADALSTALFCMPYEEGIEFVENYSGVEAMWVLSDGEQRYSSGFLKYSEKNARNS